MNRDSLVAAAHGLPEALIHGDVTLRNVGIRPTVDGEAIVLIDWELCGSAPPAFEVVHFLGNAPLRKATNETDLIDYYFGRYGAAGGTMDAATWERSVQVALLQYGVTVFPVFAGLALAGESAAEKAAVAPMVERVTRAMGDLGL